MRRVDYWAWLGGAAFAAGLAFPGAGAAQGGQIGAWIISEQYDGHGRTNVTAIATSPQGASLVVSCTKAGLDVLVSYLEPLTAGEPLRLHWRLDGGAQHDQAWAVAGDRSSFSAGPPEVAHAFLRQLAAGHSLSITAGRHHDVFDLTGGRQVSALAGACKPAAAEVTPPSP